MLLARVETQSSLWFVLTCEPARECLARDYLKARSFEPYLPEIPTVTTRGIRRKKTLTKRPMFPGYMFLRQFTGGFFNAITGRYESLIDRVMTTPGVRDFLKIGDDIAVLGEQDINRIRQTESGEREQRLSPKYSHAFLLGEQVRVGAGIFCGFHGNVAALDDEIRITILLAMLGRAVKVQLHADALEKL